MATFEKMIVICLICYRGSRVGVGWGSLTGQGEKTCREGERVTEGGGGGTISAVCTEVAQRWHQSPSRLRLIAPKSVQGFGDVTSVFRRVPRAPQRAFSPSERRAETERNPSAGKFVRRGPSGARPAEKRETRRWEGFGGGEPAHDAKMNSPI